MSYKNQTYPLMIHLIYWFCRHVQRTLNTLLWFHAFSVFSAILQLCCLLDRSYTPAPSQLNSFMKTVVWNLEQVFASCSHNWAEEVLCCLSNDLLWISYSFLFFLSSIATCWGSNSYIPFPGVHFGALYIIDT